MAGRALSFGERRLTMSADDYIGHVATISAYLELPPPQQEQVFNRIRQVLPKTVELAADMSGVSAPTS